MRVMIKNSAKVFKFSSTNFCNTFNTVISVYFDINNVLNFKVTNCCSMDIKSERITLDLQFGGTSLAIDVYTYTVKDI